MPARGAARASRNARYEPFRRPARPRAPHARRLSRASCSRTRAEPGASLPPRRCRRRDAFGSASRCGSRAPRPARNRRAAPRWSRATAATAPAMSCELHHSANGGREASPLLRLFAELLSAGSGELIEARASSQLGHAPRRSDPSLLLDAMEGGVEGTLIDLKHVLRELLDTLGDRPAVARAGDEGAENEEVERALEQVESGRWHGVACLQQDDRSLVVECQHQAGRLAVAVIGLGRADWRRRRLPPA